MKPNHVYFVSVSIYLQLTTQLVCLSRDQRTFTTCVVCLWTRAELLNVCVTLSVYQIGRECFWVRSVSYWQRYLCTWDVCLIDKGLLLLRCVSYWQMCVLLTDVHLIDRCVSYWQICVLLTNVCFIDKCVSYWQMCVLLTDLCLIDRCVSYC